MSMPGRMPVAVLSRSFSCPLGRAARWPGPRRAGPHKARRAAQISPSPLSPSGARCAAGDADAAARLAQGSAFGVGEAARSPTFEVGRPALLQAHAAGSAFSRRSTFRRSAVSIGFKF